MKDQPVLRQTRLLPAGSQALDDDAEVIGIEAGGKSRAYAVEAFLPIHRHVLNDYLGDVPVTVAYCDRTDCVSAYTGPAKNGPLDIAVGGWDGRQDQESAGMLLRVGDGHFHQGSGKPLDGAGPFPYPSYRFVRTTWKKWREAHPDSDVHVGTLPVVGYASQPHGSG